MAIRSIPRGLWLFIWTALGVACDSTGPDASSTRNGLASESAPDVQDTSAPDDGPLRAAGNEPGWLLELGDGTLRLTLDYGDRTILAALPAPDRESGVTRYTVRTDESVIDVTRRDALCADTMSGMPYPYDVTVVIDGRELRGCGGEPRDLLLGDEWLVLNIAGSGIVAGARPTLSFAADDGFSGSGPCNRYAGSYALSGEGLSVSGVAATRMACRPALMEQETVFFGVLADVYRFDIGADGTLVLHAVDGRRITARR